MCLNDEPTQIVPPAPGMKRRLGRVQQLSKWTSQAEEFAIWKSRWQYWKTSSDHQSKTQLGQSGQTQRAELGRSTCSGVAGSREQPSPTQDFPQATRLDVSITGMTNDLLYNVDSSTAAVDIRDDQDLRSAIKHLHTRKVNPNEFTHYRPTADQLHQPISSIRPSPSKLQLVIGMRPIAITPPAPGIKQDDRPTAQPHANRIDPHNNPQIRLIGAFSLYSLSY
ncbi:unnamed protein product [Caenorhabditis nigoni]